ncbi:MAG: hypothetical protein ACJ8GW_19060 [Massilia sp.]
MNNHRYWFPVKPARNGWGWGLPTVWQGWLAYLIFFAALFIGIALTLPYGQLAMIVFSCVWGGLFVGLMFWKGEPQSVRDGQSP